MKLPFIAGQIELGRVYREYHHGRLQYPQELDESEVPRDLRDRLHAGIGPDHNSTYRVVKGHLSPYGFPSQVVLNRLLLSFRWNPPPRRGNLPR